MHLNEMGGRKTRGRLKKGERKRRVKMSLVLCPFVKIEKCTRDIMKVDRKNRRDERGGKETTKNRIYHLNLLSFIKVF